MSFQILFADIDGTLLSHTTGSIPPHSLSVIAALRKQGVQVWGCTGRSPMELEALPLDGLELDGWITMNGAYCYQGSQILHQAPIAQEDIAILLQELEKDPFPVQFLECDTIYLNMVTQEVVDSLAKIHTEPDPIMDYHRAASHPIYMFIPWVKEERWNPAFKQLRYTKQVRWNDLAVDCFSVDCGKAKGIEAVLAALHLSKENALAIGDGENDIEMFEACSTSIAMGNAKEHVKAKATYVTKSIDEDGFAEMLSQIFAL